MDLFLILKLRANDSKFEKVTLNIKQLWTNFDTWEQILENNGKLRKKIPKFEKQTQIYERILNLKIIKLYTPGFSRFIKNKSYMLSKQITS